MRGAMNASPLVVSGRTPALKPFEAIVVLTRIASNGPQRVKVLGL
jgi:hypothetical protein